MNRCLASALLGLSLLANTAIAQVVVREAPADVRPGRLSITTPPDVTLNGQADRLSPGARIRNTQNIMVLSASLAGQTVPVVYRRDAAGLLHEIWLLTEDEYRRLGGNGVNSDPEGVRRFNELLALIFGGRR